MSNERAEQTATTQTPQPTATTAAPSGALANAVARLETPEAALALIQRFPAHRDAILFQLHHERGNSAVQKVVAAEQTHAKTAGHASLSAVHTALEQVAQHAWATFRAVDDFHGGLAGDEPLRQRLHVDFDAMTDELHRAVDLFAKTTPDPASRAELVQLVRIVKRNVGLAQDISRKKIPKIDNADDPDLWLNDLYARLNVDETRVEDQLAPGPTGAR